MRRRTRKPPIGHGAPAKCFRRDRIDECPIIVRTVRGFRQRDVVFERTPGEGIFPLGLWSDGEVLLTLDWRRGELLGYSLASGAREPRFDLDLPGAGVDWPRGLAADEQTLWIVDDLAKRLAAFARPR